MRWRGGHGVRWRGERRTDAFDAICLGGYGASHNHVNADDTDRWFDTPAGDPPMADPLRRDTQA